MVQSRYMNLYIVPEITTLTPTPHPVEVFSLQQDSFLFSKILLPLSDPLAPFIEPPGALVEDSTEDIHLLFHDSVDTPALGIPFQDPHVFSFQH